MDATPLPPNSKTRATPLKASVRFVLHRFQRPPRQKRELDRSVLLKVKGSGDEGTSVQIGFRSAYASSRARRPRPGIPLGGAGHVFSGFPFLSAGLGTSTLRHLGGACFRLNSTCLLRTLRLPCFSKTDARNFDQTSSSRYTVTFAILVC